LVKIGAAQTPVKEPQNKGHLGGALLTAVKGAVGTALGAGAAEVIARNAKFLQYPNENSARMVKIILPILSGTAVVLADRFRKKTQESYEKVPGYQSKK
jgi:hypothetical protein